MLCALNNLTRKKFESCSSSFTGATIAMQLRNHRLMLHRGRRNWPPAWIWTGIGYNEQPRGEVGSLYDVQIFKVDNRVVLLMVLHDVAYIGCLRFDDAAAYQRIGAILRAQIGRPIKAIGGLDLSALLSTTPGVAVASVTRRAARKRRSAGASAGRARRASSAENTGLTAPASHRTKRGPTPMGAGPL